MVGCRLFWQCFTYLESCLVYGGVCNVPDMWTSKGVRRGLEVLSGFLGYFCVFGGRKTTFWKIPQSFSLLSGEHGKHLYLENIEFLFVVFKGLCTCAGWGIPSQVFLTWRSLLLHLRRHLICRLLVLPPSIFLPSSRTVSHYLGYCCFVESFENGKWESSKFVPLFQ